MNINTLSERIHSTKFDITIDTCSAMHDGFAQFIEKNRTWFTESGIHISVSRDVVMELARNIDRVDTSAKALRAIALIRENEELFDVDIVPMTESEISQAFADSEILNRINSGRLRRPQVLITNDNDLNGDAQRLNDLKSCHGKQVYVVYLDSDGDMRTNRSLRNTSKQESGSQSNKERVTEAVPKAETPVETIADSAPSIVPAEGKHPKSGWKQLCGTTGLVLLGVAIDHYGPSAIKACTKIIKVLAKAA